MNLKFKMALLSTAILIVLASCSSNKDKSDAYGNFESDEVIISSENAGRLVYMAFNEGDKVKKGDILAITDTANLALQRAQLQAQRESILSQISGLSAQIGVTDQQIVNVKKDQVRFNKMLSQGAATPKQLDDVNGQIAIAEKQRKATQAQIESVRKNGASIDAQIAVIEERITSSVIKAPLSGTILEKYAQVGELGQPGKSIYKMANLESLLLRAYVSGPQLVNVKIGSAVKVLVDQPGGMKDYSGIVEWVSSEAEFTPKIIQTKEERVKLVYAVKIRVINDGSLKLGMPGEVKF